MYMYICMCVYKYIYEICLTNSMEYELHLNSGLRHDGCTAFMP